MNKLLFASALSFGSVIAKAQEVLTIHYAIRPPYVVPAIGDSIGGLVGAPIVLALDKAKIQYRLKQTPTSRQMMLVKNNFGAECAVGWFKNEERERFAQYSEPVFTDKRPVLIVNRKTELNLIENFSKLVQERPLRLLVKDLYSYGPYLDSEINRKARVKIERRVAEPDAMIKMITSGRADMMLASEDEAMLLFGSPGTASLQIVYLSDATKGEKRYLLCSRKVSPEVLALFNASLSK